MAERNFWTIVNGRIAKGLISFHWEPGISTAQKRRSCVNLHSALDFHCDLHALDISSASTEELGVALSAFNLEWKGIPIECWYQGSKVYSDGKLNHHLYKVTSLDAKLASKNKGPVTAFNLQGREFPTDPRTVFYDYLYLLGMCDTYGHDLDLSKYDCFTDVQAVIDIDACQARAVCMYKLLQQQGKFRVLNVFDDFLYWHEAVVEDTYPVTYFDGWLKPVDDNVLKCLSTNNSRLEGLCKTNDFSLNHLCYATYSVVKNHRDNVITNDYCVVYSDLLLDDLCALEALSRKYKKLCLVTVNEEYLPEAEYGSSKARTLIAVEAILNRWFEKVIIVTDTLSGSDISVDRAHCYLLANASKIVKDLKGNNILFGKITAMIGSDHESRRDDEEWNAAQDIDAYVELCSYGSIHKVTFTDCIRLYNDYKYWDGNYEFLEEYIRTMKQMNEDIACFDLQAVMAGMNLT